MTQYEERRSWCQQIKIHPVCTVLIALPAVVIVLVILVILIILGYIFNWGWTGLGLYVSPPHPKDSDFQRGKTLWDRLQLLVIPAVLAVAGYVINLTISRSEQEATKQRPQSEREAAAKRADLKGVTGISVEQLESQAKSLQGATMPDGGLYTTSQLLHTFIDEKKYFLWATIMQ